MKVRTRLIRAFATMILLTVIATVGGLVGFHSIINQFNLLRATIVPVHDAMVRMAELSRELADDPITYAFIQDADERASQRADYDEHIATLFTLLDTYAETDAEHAAMLREAATALVTAGRSMVMLVNQNVPLERLGEAQQIMESAEADFQQLIDAEIALETQAVDVAMTSQSSEAAVVWALGLIAIAVLSAGIALTMLLRAINTPIRRLADSAHQMAAGDYAHRVDMARSDEFGELATAFDVMADAVQKREARLKHLTETLETRVDERTHELRQAKDEAEAIFAQTSDAIALLDRDQQIVKLNPAFEMLFGVLDSVAYGTRLSDYVVPHDQPVLADMLTNVRTSVIPEIIELHCRRSDGTEFDSEAAFRKFGVRGGGAQYILCSFHDITRQKVAQHDLAEALRKERELGALKTRFVALVSHEFRTPLAVIQSSSDMIRRYWEKMDPEQRNGKVTTIQDQIQHMTGLLENFLAMSSADPVGNAFYPAPVNVAQACRAIIDEMHAISGADRVRLTAPDADVTAALDLKLFRQLLVNLITNALKYSPDDVPVEVGVSFKGDELVLTVHDDGIGIPEEDESHVYDSFHRGTNVGNIPGTGLGLAVVKRAVDAHGGMISFQSQPGNGTTFTVVLPLLSPLETAL